MTNPLKIYGQAAEHKFASEEKAKFFAKAAYYQRLGLLMADAVGDLGAGVASYAQTEFVKQLIEFGEGHALASMSHEIAGRKIGLGEHESLSLMAAKLTAARARVKLNA